MELDVSEVLFVGGVDDVAVAGRVEVGLPVDEPWPEFVEAFWALDFFIFASDEASFCCCRIKVLRIRKISPT